MRYLLFFLLPFLLHAETPFRLSADSEPMITIGNCVNVSTGDFFVQSDDIVVDGPEPLIFSRIYDSNNNIPSQLGSGMFFSFPTGLEKGNGSKPNMLIEEQGGAYLPYKGKKENNKETYWIDGESFLKTGVTNTGHIESRGRVQDRIISRENDIWKIELPDGSIRTY